MKIDYLRRILSLLLTVLMVFTMLECALPTFAEDGNGDETIIHVKCDP